MNLIEQPLPLSSHPLAAETLETSSLEAAPPAADLPRRSFLHYVFVGPGGLRPGWGALLFILLIVAFGQVTTFVVHQIHPHAPLSAAQRQIEAAKPQTPADTIRREGIAFALVALASWIMGRIERRPVGSYGFGGRRKAARFFTGFAWGAGFLSLLVAILWKAGLLVFDGRLLSGPAIYKYAAIWLIGFVLVGLFEEYFLRGYLQYTLSRGATSLYRMFFDTQRGNALGFWTTALVLSFLFGAIHDTNPGESPFGLASAGLIGVIFCLSLWRTGSLWWALGFHAAWDWAQSFVFGVADSGTMVEGHLMATHPVGRVLLSGGATGPEGSIFIFPVLLLIALTALWTLPRESSRGLEAREGL